MDEAQHYLMENPEEALRLDVKTDPEAVKRQAELCGIGPGARVLDGGCGSGKTTSVLYELIQPGGSIVGIDFAENRIRYAKEHYEQEPGIEFRCMDLRQPLGDLGSFDFIWVRFVLEYYLEGSVDIIRNVSRALNADGRLCLLDLDYNCLSHYPLKPEMEYILHRMVDRMTRKYNFDPYVGRKLYSYLYTLGFSGIEVNLIPHHLIYGSLKTSDDFNWIKKIEMASVKASDLFKDYPGGYEGFFIDFNTFFKDPGRFTYTPLMVCTGRRPPDGGS
ncbi:MAG TPA: methyltransferase domain-containing protein [Deltaproteobacteria bacterium]|nr:methyltransferase domain-containing protein [Deltaproteobacteria bacterium]HPR55440.1 methyltransferase domain-containing protein [Deltaproteobacteria bacterium]HXK47996.1 methyltransferase domain-containing protein [Deltaproteobacteria bacterium]